MRGRTLQKSNHRDTEYTEKNTQRSAPAGSSNPPGRRTSSDMVRRDTCSKNQFLSHASLLLKPAKRVGECRDRPWVVLCVFLCPLCLCGESAARPCGHLASKAEIFGSGFPGEAR